MYKILIVDDEKNHRTGLMKLLYTIYPEDMLLEAECGEEAMEVLKYIECDMVITDIRMDPGMDGLELLRRIREKKEDTAVIILSGYGEFGYAKRALKLGAADYLLKPVEPSEVKTCLDAIRRQIAEKREQIEDQRSMKSQLQETEPVYLEYLMQQFVSKREFAKKEKIRELFPLEREGYLILCEIRMEGKRKPEEKEIRELRLILKEQMDPDSSYSFETQYQNLYAVLVLSDRIQEKTAFFNLGEKLKKECGMSEVIFYVSEIHKNLFYEAVEAYEEAIQMWNYRFYELGICSFYAQMKGRLGADTEKNPDFTEAVIEKLKRNDTLGAFSEIREYLNRVSEERLIFPGKLKRTIMFSVFQILQNLDLLLSEELKKETDNILMKLYEAENRTGFLKLLYQYLLQIGKDINFQKETKGIDVLNHCREYMEQHYMEEISLDAMAEKYYFNASYFSTIFSNYFGKSFTNYLIEIRMRKAKELLTESKNKIKEIAAETGYKDANYFIRAFKKYYGYTPDEYRKLISQDQIVRKTLE